MSRKPETQFSALLHSKLPNTIYIEKTANPYRAGMPDFYMEGPKSIIWAEHKYIEKPWTTDKMPSALCKTTAWMHQRHWLERAYNNNKQAYVIIGTGKREKALAVILAYPFSFQTKDHTFLPLDTIRSILTFQLIGEHETSIRDFNS